MCCLLLLLVLPMERAIRVGNAKRVGVGVGRRERNVEGGFSKLTITEIKIKIKN